MESLDNLRRQYFQMLIDGSRRECRKLLAGALAEGRSAEDLLLEMIWPAMDELATLFREDRIDFAVEHIATRINRSLADQLQGNLPSSLPNGKNTIVCCSDVEGHELGAQILTDLLEAEGWEVRFIGSGVPMDELVQLIGRVQPQLVVYYGTEPGGIPEVRRTLLHMRRIAASPGTTVLTSGGVFNRTEGLWIEVGADAFAPDARTAVQMVREGIKLREHFVPEQGQPKRRRRKKTLLAPT